MRTRLISIPLSDKQKLLNLTGVLKALELLAENDDPNLATMRNIRAKIRDGLNVLETPKLSRKGRLKVTRV